MSPVLTGWFALLGALAWVPAPLLAQTCAHCNGDAKKEAEHNALYALVPTGEATHVASANGAWSASSTWNGGVVPGVNAKVHIPQGRTVTYDVQSSAALRWVRVDGTLTFHRTVTTTLTVDTIVVTDTGVWEQGTASNPISSSVSSTITFSDTGAVTDTMVMGRGLLTKGRVRIHGATVTPFVRAAANALSVGATSLTLQSAPSGWRSQVPVLVTGMKLTDNPWGTDSTSTDEVRTIGSVSGTSLSVTSGLSHSRNVDWAQHGGVPHVAMLWRNVTFRSANTTDAARKAHTMFMHNPDVDIRYAQFEHMGRTRKDIDVTDLPSNTPSGSNPRGRYAVHVHRAGKDDRNATPARIVGCVVRDATSWGYVSHDSHVVFEDNVAYNCLGASFITENGGEIGAFRRNLAARTRGRTQTGIKTGSDRHDLAMAGFGFWFQGGNVVVEDNVATGNRSAGFSNFTRSGQDLGANVWIYRQNLLDYEAAGGLDYIKNADSPLSYFKRNLAIGNWAGFHSVDTEINNVTPTDTTIEDYVDINSLSNAGVETEYYRNFTFRRVKVLRDSTMAESWRSDWAVRAASLVDHLYPWETRAHDRFVDMYVRGYSKGLQNDTSDTRDSFGHYDRKAKYEILNNSYNFVSKDNGVAIANTGVADGQPLVVYRNESSLLYFPSFDPPAGTHNGPVNVTIGSVPGAEIYYVTGNVDANNPAYTHSGLNLKPGSWTAYTGPVALSSRKWLIAIAKKDGIYSRPRAGVYSFVPGAARVSSPGFSASGNSVSITSATSGSAVRYTTDGSDPRLSKTGRSINNGGTITAASGQTVRAFAYKAAMVDSAVVSYEVGSGSASAGSSTSGSTTGTASGQPDLRVSDISWSPAQPAAGQAVTFSAVVRNDGTAASPAGTVIGVLFSVGGTAVSWATDDASGLAAGASRTITATGGPSGSPQWTATAGSHTVQAQADDVNRVTESNEGNNAASENLTVSGGSGGSGTGLSGAYFNNATLSGAAAFTRTDAGVDFNWNNGSPGSGVGSDNFSVRWSGEVEATTSGSYVFQTESDDGVRVWLNGTLVINNWTDHAPTVNSSSAISLTAGQRYPLVMEYYEKGGGAVARLRWQTPGSSAGVAIPAAQLYPGSGTVAGTFEGQDIGSVGQAGSTVTSGSTLTVDGGGADIWGTSDAFHLAVFSRDMDGDGEIVARVASVENTDPWAKAGVMIRGSLDAGAPHAFMAVTTGNGLAFQYRTTANGGSGHSGASGAAPRWVRVVRSGNTFTGSVSSDGATWTSVGSATITMGTSVKVGLAVTAHNNGTLCTATFDNVAVVE